jgi:Na+-driven multidrug efflux pump
MAAQNIGAGNWSRVSRIARTGVLFSLILTGALIASLMLLDRQVLALFLGSGSPAIPIAENILLTGTWGFLFFGVGLVLFGIVRANGQVVGPLIILFISMYPVRLGFAFGSYEALGTDALWLSFPVGMVATSVMAGALYLHGGWRQSRMALSDMPDETECREQAESAREPGGAVQPAG